MNALGPFHLFATGVCIILGIVVFRTNPQRATNQIFLILSCLLALWLLFMSAAFAFTEPVVITYFVRSCHSVAAFFPLAFDWLRRSIINPKKGLRFAINSSPVWMGVSLAIAVLSFAPFFIESVSLPAAKNDGWPSVAEPEFGPAYWIYGCFYAVSLGVLVHRFYKTFREHDGIQKTELHFILLGAGASILTGFILVIVPPVLLGSSQSSRLAPVSVVVLYSIIAYGIATSRIMDVAYFFRTVTAYTLLTLYLMAFYLIVWWPLTFLYRQVALEPGLVPHLSAALAVAFSLAPIHGRMQRVANRLFVHFAPMDVNAVVQSANQILQSISTVDKLLEEFADIVCRAVGTDRVIILLPSDGSFVQRHPTNEGTLLAQKANEPLPQLLMRSDEAFVPDMVRRLRPTAVQEEACSLLDRHQIKAAIGMRSKEGLEGIVLVGPRLSGRIYGATEQQALRLLSNQLAAALNNARLYTQVQDGKIYNDILVDNLASGVIAADNDGSITIFNREAQRIIRVEATATLNQPVSVLPIELSTVLNASLRQGYGVRDREIILRTPAGDETPVRVSSSVFYNHAGRILGAFLAMSDLTAVKRLEMQVRRTDRLASLGTLAAGMAHEIKNPLVSIKTFTQLLPERHEDSDFRQTFFSLVGDEVRRIDSIVNQLLRFSRPAKPHLIPTHLHEVLNNSLKLMSQQMRQRAIHLALTPQAPNDLIQADGDQLSQALINLFLNAIESMTQGGTLTVSTGPASPEFSPEWWGGSNDHRHVQVSIGDTGEGIKPEDLSHIFDPFFTTKSQGTGLGLSVAHGIIQEHGGAIDVKSEFGRGTTFSLIFPLLDKDPSA